MISKNYPIQIIVYFLALDEQLGELLKDVESFLTKNDPKPEGIQNNFTAFRKDCIAKLSEAKKAMDVFKDTRPRPDLTNY